MTIQDRSTEWVESARSLTQSSSVPLGMLLRDTRRDLRTACDALEAVLERHRPVEVWPSDPICSDCSFRLPNGRFFGKLVEWPCPTVADIETALRVTARPPNPPSLPRL